MKVLRDDTARKQAEGRSSGTAGAREAARQDAENATRLKDQFLATLSHELGALRSRAILVWAKMLRQNLVEPG